MIRDKTYHIALLSSILAILGWSVVKPYDLLTWFLEVLPVLIGLVALFVLYPRFKFSNLVYGLIWWHAIILIVGGHYSYAEMPLFNWIRDTLALERNYYDRVGHFAQGFVPAMIAREVLLRRTPLVRGRWLNFLVLCICLAISAMYELLEFAAAMLMGAMADSFLGSQGDVWDSQWDMTYALLGAIFALLTLGKWHDKSMQGRVAQNR